MRWSTGVTLSLLLALGAGGAVVACSSGGGEEYDSASRVVRETNTFDKDYLLDDDELTNATALDAQTIQTFLENKRSALATYEENGKSAAELLVEAGDASQVSPLELLVRLQMERGLVSKTKERATDTDFQRALGCGCPDTAPCDPEYAGFGPQMKCSARTIRRALDKLAAGEPTAGGWQKGKTQQTLDPLDVTPKTNATAALYNYTPWVGEAGGGRAEIGGCSLHMTLWNGYSRQLGSAVTAHDAGAPVDAGPVDTGTTTHDAAPPPARDAGKPGKPDAGPPDAGTADAATAPADAGPPAKTETPAEQREEKSTTGRKTPRSNHDTSLGSLPKEEAPGAGDGDGEDAKASGCAAAGAPPSSLSALGVGCLALMALVLGRRRRG